jgi:hypothetical protein
MPIRLGPFELIIVLVIVVIIFGVGRLPEIGGAVGKDGYPRRERDDERGRRGHRGRDHQRLIIAFC